MNSDKAKLALFVGELNKATGADLKLYANTVIKSFPIFNFSQLENVPELEVKDANTFEPIKRAEGLLVASGAKIYHNNTNTNYYLPEKHEIHLTSKESFKSPEAYYSTALHELAHWTKGDDLPRHIKADEKAGNGHDIAYAREELRAELASVFMAADLNLKLDIQNHSNYLGAYLKELNHDYNEFFSAVSDAQKISNHVLGFEKRLDLESPEAETLRTKNPELYLKIVEFNAKTYDFKVGDTFIGKADNNEFKQFEVIKVANDTLHIKDASSGIVHEEKYTQFQNILDNYHAEKLDTKSPQVVVNQRYQEISQDLLNNEYFGVGKQNLEGTFIFPYPSLAQLFVDELMNEHDVPGNMINTSNFERHDRTQSYLISKDDSTGIAVAAQDHPNKVYLERFFEEKDLPLTNFTITTESGQHFVESDVVIDYLVKTIDAETQGKVRKILTELDFKNADITDFLKHCAVGMVKQYDYEASHDLEVLDNTTSNNNFKENEIKHELANEPDTRSTSSSATPKVASNINDDNDFSM